LCGAANVRDASAMPEKAQKAGLKNNFDQRIFVLVFFVNIFICGFVA
jgi:hypothetical protein